MADLNELNEKLSEIKSKIESDLKEINSSKGIFEYRKSVMDSKEGKIGSLMKEMGKIPKELKADYGKKVNEIRNWAQEKLRKRSRRHVMTARSLTLLFRPRSLRRAISIRIPR